LGEQGINAFQAASDRNAAVWGAMRSAYARLTGRSAPIDDTAVFNDYELD
jgi:hypothetical protein